MQAGAQSLVLIYTHPACLGEQRLLQSWLEGEELLAPRQPVPLESTARPGARFNCILRGWSAPASRAVPPGPFLVQQGETQDQLRATCTPPTSWLNLLK